jgi:hypothetical protein
MDAMAFPSPVRNTSMFLFVPHNCFFPVPLQVLLYNPNPLVPTSTSNIVEDTTPKWHNKFLLGLHHLLMQTSTDINTPQRVGTITTIDDPPRSPITGLPARLTQRLCNTFLCIAQFSW